jgi:hypothetical protein
MTAQELIDKISEMIRFGIIRPDTIVGYRIPGSWYDPDVITRVEDQYTVPTDPASPKYLLLS